MARARNTDNNKTKEKKVAALNHDEIMALLSKTRQKGVYTERLNSFIESAEPGICVNDTWADLSGKKATTLKQGFEAAKDKKEAAEGSDKVIVKSDKAEDGTERVYLINLALVEGYEQAEAA